MIASTAEAHRNVPITIGNVTVAPGRVSRFELPFAKLPTGTDAALPVAVINGRFSGPHVWVSGVVHGDEINGIEIIRQLLRKLDPKAVHGAVIAVPIVNVLGFLNETRYLPDRRDLNRSFPGSTRGSVANRLAGLFMREVVAQCSIGIDLHTATNHRINIPQIRADLDDAETMELARAFGAPFAIHAKLRDGSLRQAATERDIRVLLYEAGQAHRFDTAAIDAGVEGTLRVLRHLGVFDSDVSKAGPVTEVRSTRWIRARRGGIATLNVELGQHVDNGGVIGTISDAFGHRPSAIKSTISGWVIARSLNPLVAPGDALIHVTADGANGDEPAERRRRR